MWSVTGVLSFLNLLLIVHLIIHGDAENRLVLLAVDMHCIVEILRCV